MQLQTDEDPVGRGSLERQGKGRIPQDKGQRDVFPGIKDTVTTLSCCEHLCCGKQQASEEKRVNRTEGKLEKQLEPLLFSEREGRHPKEPLTSPEGFSRLPPAANFAAGKLGTAAHSQALCKRGALHEPLQCPSSRASSPQCGAAAASLLGGSGGGDISCISCQPTGLMQLCRITNATGNPG